MAGVSLKKVVKSFGKVEVVKGIDLEIEDGSFAVLVGPSGCGKTTTLRMIAGLEEVTGGVIKIDNNNVTHVPPKDRDIAMVFQNYALYPHMTVRENMEFALKIRKRPRKLIEERVDEASEILGLSKYLHRKPKELSGGQRQRVALGRAIVRQPAVFLMDEPLSNLDAKLRVQMRGELKKLHERLGATFIYVTHDQVEAMTLGDKIVVMNDGIIKQYDKPMTVYKKPANTFVAGFIGSPAMNFFDGKILKKGDEHVFMADGFELVIPKGFGFSKSFTSVLGKDVILGVRPEDIVNYQKAVRKKYTKHETKATVEFAEFLGAQTYVHVSINSNNFLAEVDPSFDFKLGQKVGLGFYLKKMHLFDKHTQTVII